MLELITQRILVLEKRIEKYGKREYGAGKQIAEYAQEEIDTLNKILEIRKSY